MNHQILFYLSLILVVCLIPVYLYRRNWKEAAIIAGVIGYFFILNRSLFWSESFGVYHDTKMDYEYILTFLKQWLDGNLPIGWNPYMNGGEPLYLFSNIFLWTPWVIFCWINRFIGLAPHFLFTLFWLFLFVNFCIGAFLLFCSLYDSFPAALFAFVTLMFSGMFNAALAQPAPLTLMYYFPFILFAIISSLKTKNIYGISLSIVLFGILANHYIPHYTILSVSIILCIVFLFNFNWLTSMFRLIRSKYRVVILAFIFSLLAASPALFTYRELQNYSSPLRGGSIGRSDSVDKAKNKQFDSQATSRASWWGYKILLFANGTFMGKTHHAFYFGIIPLVMIPFAFLSKEKPGFAWVFLISALLIAYLGTGNDAWLFRFITRQVPGFNVLRLSFSFAQFAAFLLIVLAGFGCKEFLNKVHISLVSKKERNFVKSFYFIILVTLLLNLSSAYSIIEHHDLRTTPPDTLNRHTVDIYGIQSCGDFSRIIYPDTRSLHPAKAFDLGYLKYLKKDIISRLFNDKIMHKDKYNPSHIYFDKDINTRKQLMEKLKKAEIYDELNMIHTLWKRSSYLLPPDISPIIYKKASLTLPAKDYIFFRNSRFDDMLNLYIPGKGYEAAMGIDTPLFYFTRNVKSVPENIPPEKLIKSIYQDSLENAFPADRSVFLENGPGLENRNTDIKPKNAKIRYRQITDPNNPKLLVKAPYDGYLVRLENYHSGWSAIIDGQETRIYRANYAFQAIRVPKGVHKISFRFSTIYPALFWLHIGVVCLVWLLFNSYLVYINKFKATLQPGLEKV